MFCYVKENKERQVHYRSGVNHATHIRHIDETPV